MKLKNLKWQNLLLTVAISAAYPAVRAFTLPEGRRLFFFCDAITVIGLILVILGVIYLAIQKGDFDITTYIGKRFIERDRTKPFSEYRKDREEEHAETFNYPLFTAILFLLTAAVIALFFL